jgi:lycopene cyclase domain-containing protein
MDQTPPLTYLGFLALAVVPPVAALAVAAGSRRLASHRWAGAALMVALALAYTTPWDNYLVARGVWHYGEGTVRLRLWHAPFGEYLFVVLQTVGAALWSSLLLHRESTPSSRVPRDVSRRERASGALAGLGVGLAGLAGLAAESTFYLGAILAWAGPVLALQWGFGWRHLWRRRGLVAVGVAVPTAYLWVADRLALGLGLWVLSPQYTTGAALAGLPVEEAAFFLATNLFLVQGLVLLEWVVAADWSLRRAYSRLETTYPGLAAVVDRWA